MSILFVTIVRAFMGGLLLLMSIGPSNCFISSQNHLSLHPALCHSLLCYHQQAFLLGNPQTLSDYTTISYSFLDQQHSHLGFSFRVQLTDVWSDPALQLFGVADWQGDYFTSLNLVIHFICQLIGPSQNFQASLFSDIPIF